MSRISELIETDFIDYFDRLVKEQPLFPHDYDLPDDEFVKRYQNRIKNFLEVMQSEKLIYFIHSDYLKVPLRKDILHLYDVLERKLLKNNKFFLFMRLDNL